MALTVDGKDVTVTAVAIGDVTVSLSTPIGLAASNRQISVPLAGVKALDVLSARPLGAVPDGYDIGAAFCVTDGTLVVIIAHPALTLGGSFSINLRIMRIMS
jgi:hypothetical protein